MILYLPIHVASAWADEASLVLGQLCMDEKTNEIKAIQKELKVLWFLLCIASLTV